MPHALLEAPLALLLVALPIAGCADAPSPGAAPDGGDSALAVQEVSADSAPPYDLAHPDGAFELPPALREVSGLSPRPDGRLAAVQDERGVLYSLDPATGAIVDERRFSDGGDYEGVEWADGATWVLKSNGELFAVPDAGGDVVEYETPLSSSCDAEGLALDAARHRLLVSCKEDAGRDLPGLRAVYAFDLATRTMAEAPALVVDRRALDDGGDTFKPAGLAVHPETGMLYLISSVRKALAVLSPTGEVLSVTPLPEALYRQPEGIAFAPDGTLYISNEGAGGEATLLRFAPRR